MSVLVTCYNLYSEVSRIHIGVFAVFNVHRYRNFGHMLHDKDNITNTSPNTFIFPGKHKCVKI